MGKGDKRSRRGKIFAGSYGKSRPKPKKAVLARSEAAEGATGKAAPKPKVRVKKKTESA